MNHKLEMVKAYIYGSLRGARANEDNQYILGYEAGIRSVQEFIETLEQAIDGAEKKNEDSWN